MHYFDSNKTQIDVRHVMASGALPPAFRLSGSTTTIIGTAVSSPIRRCEAVFDDNPRRNSVVFSVDIWNPQGADPATIGDVVVRQQEVQFSSRLVSHIRRQKQIHRLRHIISDLAGRLPEDRTQIPGDTPADRLWLRHLYAFRPARRATDRWGRRHERP